MSLPGCPVPGGTCLTCDDDHCRELPRAATACPERSHRAGEGRGNLGSTPGPARYTFLDHAQLAQFERFLTNPRADGVWQLDPFTYEWATGERGHPNITPWTFPG